MCWTPTTRLRKVDTTWCSKPSARRPRWRPPWRPAARAGRRPLRLLRRPDAQLGHAPTVQLLDRGTIALAEIQLVAGLRHAAEAGQRQPPERVDLAGVQVRPQPLVEVVHQHEAVHEQA